MKEKNKGLIIKYLVPSLLGLLTAFGIMWARGIFDISAPDKIISLISDGFFTVGMLFTGIGLLLWISTTGVLDIISYGFKSLIVLFTLAKKKPDEGGFYEYKIRQKEKRRPVPFQILWVGLIFIVIAGVLVFMYYNVK